MTTTINDSNNYVGDESDLNKAAPGGGNDEDDDRGGRGGGGSEDGDENHHFKFKDQNCRD